MFKEAGIKREKALGIFIIILFVFFVALVLILSLLWLKTEKTAVLTAQKGRVNISDETFKLNQTFILNGEWEFYWNKLISPTDFKKAHKKSFINFPSSWGNCEAKYGKYPNEGIATYRLVILSNRPIRHAAIKSKMFISACKMWINGENALNTGIVGKDQKSHVGRFNPDVILIENPDRRIEIVLQVSNFGYANGGLASSFIFGNAKYLVSEDEKRTFVDAFLFGTILIMGLYNLILYLLRRKDISVLYLSLVCFLISVRTLFMGNMLVYNLVEKLELDVFLKISMLTLSFSIMLFAMFINSLYSEEVPKLFIRFAQTVSILYSAITILLPDKFNDYFLMPFELVCVLIFTGILIILINAVSRKREGAGLVLLAVVIIYGVIINDILNQIGILKTAYLIPVGLFLFLFAQTLMLSKKFSDSFYRVEEMSYRLLLLDKLKNEFLANTTHELKTPINGVIGIAQSMIDAEDISLGEMDKNNLSLIISSGKRLSILIDDILDFSMLESKNIELNKRPTDIKSLVDIVITHLKPLSSGKPLSIINKIDEKLPMADADENRLVQILFNLIANAVKFTEKGNINVIAMQKDENIFVSVEDTGIGISEDKKELIFNSFAQADSSISREYGGTGLGLSITKKLVELHGGEMWLDSKVGEGSVFSFSLPVSNEKLSDKIPSAHQNKSIIPEKKHYVHDIELTHVKRQESQKTESILVVDDDLVNLQVLFNILYAQKFNVILAKNGKEAIDIIEEGTSLNMVILDVMMPKVSGYEVLKKIREKYTLTDLPVLLLTARNRPEDIIVGFETGANDYLEKPFEKYELMARIKALITLKKNVEQEERLLKSELRMLQAQIKPHFLFNALNTIISFIRINPESAHKLLLEFSNYLRKGFSFKDDEELIDFTQELSHIRSYLVIEEARFAERLIVVYDIDEGIKCKIPPLILEPIVENAVKHGLLSKEEGGTLLISAKETEEGLSFVVEDNGVGMSEEKLKAVLSGNHKAGGIGVGNVNSRLMKLYGRKLQILSVPNYGTKVTVNIPYLMEVSG